MSCQRYADAIVDHACGAELGPDAAAHLTVCRECRQRLDEQRRLVNGMDAELQAALAIEPSPRFTADVLARVERRSQGSRRWVWWTTPAVAAAVLALVGVVLINEGQRRIPVHHAKRVRSGRVYGGTTTNIPLKVNSAGMIPLIFAVSIMVFPGMIASFLESSNTEWVQNLAGDIRRWLSPNTFIYNVVYFFMVVGFTFFYTMVVFQQQRIPESLQRQADTDALE